MQRRCFILWVVITCLISLVTSQSPSISASIPITNSTANLFGNSSGLLPCPAYPTPSPGFTGYYGEGRGLYDGIAGENNTFIIIPFPYSTVPPNNTFCFNFTRLDGPTMNVTYYVTNNPNGTYSVNWTTPYAGRYILYISECSTGRLVYVSPYFPIVVANQFSPCNTTVSGNYTSILACSTTPATLTIRTKDAYGNPIRNGGQQYYANFTPSAGVSYVFRDSGDGIFTLSYTISIVGNYTLVIGAYIGVYDIQAVPLCQSPLFIQALPGSAFSPGNSIIQASTGFACAANVYYLQLRDACGNVYTGGNQSAGFFNLITYVVSPSGRLINNTLISALGNGLFQVNFSSTSNSSSGSYTIYAFGGTPSTPFLNSPFTTSPFTTQLGQVTSQSIVAYGAGFNSGVGNGIGTFFIDTRDACGNPVPTNYLFNITLFTNPLLDPNGNSQQVGLGDGCFTYIITNLNNGTYRVDYNAPLSGSNFILNIYVNEDPTTGLPIDIRQITTNGTILQQISNTPKTISFNGPSCVPASCGNVGYCCAGLCRCPNGETPDPLLGCSGGGVPSAIAQVKWSDVGNSILFTFTAATDRGLNTTTNYQIGNYSNNGTANVGATGNFPCSQILYIVNNPTVSLDYALGNGSYCFWQSDYVIVAVTGINEPRGILFIGSSVIGVKPNTVKPRSGLNYILSRGILRRPDLIPSAVPQLSAEQILVGSDNQTFYLDASSSFGSAGRQFVNTNVYNWTVATVPLSSVNGNTSDNLDAINSILRAASTNPNVTQGIFDPIIQDASRVGVVGIPYSLFNPNYIYQFNLSLQNFQNGTGTLSGSTTPFSVQRKLLAINPQALANQTIASNNTNATSADFDPRPHVQIVGPSAFKMYNWQDVTLKGSAILPYSTLPGSVNEIPLISYSWVIASINSANQNLYTLDPNLANTPSLYIPANSLSPSTIYVFRLAATVNDSLGNLYENYADVEVFVLQSYARAIVNPSALTISRLDYITLNASMSLRPDQNPIGVTYDWGCVVVSSTGQQCFSTQDQQYYFTGNSVISLLPATLHPGSYTFTLEVIDGGENLDKGQGFRSRFNSTQPLQDIPAHYTTVTINVVVPPVPLVSILPIRVAQGPNLGTVDENPYSENNQITSDTLLRIQGQVSSRRPITSLSWSYYPTIFPLSSIALTPVNNSLDLAIKPSSLYAGIVYRFILTATSADGTGSSSTDVYVVQPPTSGDLIVSNTQPVNTVYPGSAGLVQFNATALFWEDVNGSNPYRFWIKNVAPLLVNTYNLPQNNNTIFGNDSIAYASSTNLRGPTSGEGIAPNAVSGDVPGSLNRERPFTTSSKLSNKLQNVYLAKGANVSSIVLYVEGSSHSAYRKEINYSPPALNNADCPSNTTINDGSCQLALVQAILGLDGNNNNNFTTGNNGSQQCLFCYALNSGDNDLLTQLLFAVTDLLNQGPLSSSGNGTLSNGTISNIARILLLKKELRGGYLLPALDNLQVEPTVQGYATLATLLANLVGSDPSQLSLDAQNDVLARLAALSASGVNDNTLQTIIDTLSFLLTGNNLLYANYSRLFNQSAAGNLTYGNGTVDQTPQPTYDYRSRSLNPVGPYDTRGSGDFGDYESCSGNLTSFPCACASPQTAATNPSFGSSDALVDIPYQIGLFTINKAFPGEAPVLWQPPSANVLVLAESVIVQQGMNLSFIAGGVNVTLPSDFPVIYNNYLGINQVHTINVILIVYPYEDPRAFSPTATYRVTPVVSLYLINAENGSFVDWRALYPNYGQITANAPTQYFYNTNGTITALNTSVLPNSSAVIGPTYYYNPLYAGADYTPIGAVLYTFARTRSLNDVDPLGLNLAREPNVVCQSWDNSTGYTNTGVLTSLSPASQQNLNSPYQADRYTCSFGMIGTQVAGFYQFPQLLPLAPGPVTPLKEYSSSSSSFDFNWGLLILWVFFAVMICIVGMIAFCCYTVARRPRGTDKIYYVLPPEGSGLKRVEPNVAEGETLRTTPLGAYYVAGAVDEEETPRRRTVTEGSREGTHTASRESFDERTATETE